MNLNDIFWKYEFDNFMNALSDEYKTLIYYLIGLVLKDNESEYTDTIREIEKEVQNAYGFDIHPIVESVLNRKKEENK